MGASNVWKVWLYTLILYMPHYGTKCDLWSCLSQLIHWEDEKTHWTIPCHEKRKKKKKPYIKKAIKTTPNSSNGIQLKWIDLRSTVSVFILKPLLPHGTSVRRCHEAWDRCEKELWCYPFMFNILWQHALMNTSQPNKAPHFQNSHTHSIRHVKMYSWWL